MFKTYKEIWDKPISNYNYVCINKDIPRIIPNHSFYSDKYEEGKKILKRLLMSICIYFKDTGYLCSFGLIWSKLLLYMSEEDAFLTVKFLMENEEINKWLIQDNQYIDKTFYIFKRLLAKYLTEIYEYFKAQDIHPMIYASTWFISLFSSKISVEEYPYFFDQVIVEGYISWYKLALSILDANKESILNSDSDNLYISLSTISNKKNKY